MGKREVFLDDLVPDDLMNSAWRGPATGALMLCVGPTQDLSENQSMEKPAIADAAVLEEEPRERRTAGHAPLAVHQCTLHARPCLAGCIGNWAGRMRGPATRAPVKRVGPALNLFHTQGRDVGTVPHAAMRGEEFGQ